MIINTILVKVQVRNRNHTMNLNRDNFGNKEFLTDNRISYQGIRANSYTRTEKEYPKEEHLWKGREHGFGLLNRKVPWAALGQSWSAGGGRSGLANRTLNPVEW